MIKHQDEIMSAHWSTGTHYLDDTNITQLHKFQCQKNNLNPGEITINKDFSENDLIKHQDEIMSVNWSTGTHYLDGNNQKQTAQSKPKKF